MESDGPEFKSPLPLNRLNFPRLHFLKLKKKKKMPTLSVMMEINNILVVKWFPVFHTMIPT